MYLALALDGLGAVARAFQPYLCLSAVKGDVAVGLDAFRRDAALGVLLPLAGGDDAHGAVVDDNLVVAVDALASDAGGLDVQFAAVDGDEAVGLDARAGGVVALVGVVFVAAAGEDGGAPAVDAHFAVGGDALVGGSRDVDVDHAARDDDGVVASDAVAGGGIDEDVGLGQGAHVVVAADAGLAVGVDLKIARAAEDELAFAEEAGLHVLVIGRVGVVCAICEKVFRAVVEDDEGALLALVVDGRTVGVGDADTVEHDGLFLRGVELEEAVGGGAGQHIADDFAGGVGGDDIVAADADNAIVVALYRRIGGGAEGDGDGALDGGVLKIVFVAVVGLIGLGDGVLVEGYGERSDVAGSGYSADDIVGCGGGLRVVVVARRGVRRVGPFLVIPVVVSVTGCHRQRCGDGQQKLIRLLHFHLSYLYFLCKGKTNERERQLFSANQPFYSANQKSLFSHKGDCPPCEILWCRQHLKQRVKLLLAHAVRKQIGGERLCVVNARQL